MSTSFSQSLAEMFKPAEGSWECPGCYVNNNADVLRCLACQTVKPGAKPEEVKSPPKEDPFAPAAPTGGFGGFKFGASTGDKKVTCLFPELNPFRLAPNSESGATE